MRARVISFWRRRSIIVLILSGVGIIFSWVPAAFVWAPPVPWPEPSSIVGTLLNWFMLLLPLGNIAVFFTSAYFWCCGVPSIVSATGDEKMTEKDQRNDADGGHIDPP